MNLKLLLYPAVSITVIFLILILVLQRWQITISFEPLESQETLFLEPPLAETPLTASTASSPSPTPEPTLTDAVKTREAPAVVAAPPGVLRLSNQTEHPVRVAFLARQEKIKSSNSKQSVYGEPAHWDFAPEEGTQQGLLLSLPTGFVKLERGDILVAFAQDGTRRYWGPYVVGSTPMPVWDRKTSEWQLILQP